MEEKIVYFEEPGIGNTETTLRLAAERAKARGIKKIALWAGTGIKIVVVPHQYGFMAGTQRFPAELVAQLNKKGHEVHFGTMLFHTDHLYGSETPRVLANLLRTFCQGMKVCVEITLMAVDGGQVAPGEQVIVVAGTGRGADTAVVAIAASSTRMPELHITEIICKPLQTKTMMPPPPQMPPPPPEKKA
jgi:hypothetical protein